MIEQAARTTIFETKRAMTLEWRLRAARSDFFSLLANIVRQELLHIILYNGGEPVFHFSTQLYTVSHDMLDRKLKVTC
jgi:hypothetical protein